MCFINTMEGFGDIGGFENESQTSCEDINNFG